MDQPFFSKLSFWHIFWPSSSQSPWDLHVIDLQFVNVDSRAVPKEHSPQPKCLNPIQPKYVDPSQKDLPDQRRFHDAPSLFETKQYDQVLHHFTDFIKEYPEKSLAFNDWAIERENILTFYFSIFLDFFFSFLLFEPSIFSSLVNPSTSFSKKF